MPAPMHHVLAPTVEGLVRVWAREALWLFQGRLVSEEGPLLGHQNVDAVAQQRRPAINFDEALAHPILFSNWTLCPG